MSDPIAQEALGHLRALLALDTTNPPGNESLATEYLRGVLEVEGIACQVAESEPGREIWSPGCPVGVPPPAWLRITAHGEPGHGTPPWQSPTQTRSAGNSTKPTTASMTTRTAIGDFDPKSPELLEILKQVTRQYEQAWLDHPIPALSGRTPRECAADPTRRPVSSACSTAFRTSTRPAR